MQTSRTRYAILAVLVVGPLMSGLIFGPRGAWPGAVGSATGGLIAWSLLACFNRRFCS